MNAPSLTAAEWFELLQLVTEVAAAGDEHDADRYVSHFFESAIVDHHDAGPLDDYWGANAKLDRVEGRGAIREHRGRIPRLPVRSHVVSNFRVLEVGDGWYRTEFIATVVTPDRDHPTVLRMSTVVDRIERDNDSRPRIAERHIHFHATGALAHHELIDR